jgi:hypothetical protein
VKGNCHSYEFGRVPVSSVDGLGCALFGTRIAALYNALTEESEGPVEIRFVSSLTADDEDRIAPALLTAIATLLDQFPIAYTVRIETVASKTYQQHSLPDANQTATMPYAPSSQRADTLAGGVARAAEAISRSLSARPTDH